MSLGDVSRGSISTSHQPITTIQIIPPSNHPTTIQLPTYHLALHTHISHGKHTVVSIAPIERFVPRLVVEKSQSSASDQAESAGLILGARFIHVQTDLDLFRAW